MSAKIIKELLPSSQRWFVFKGYAIHCEEDGVQTLKLTKAGEEYFARITSGGEKHVVENSTDSRRKAPE